MAGRPPLSQRHRLARIPPELRTQLRARARAHARARARAEQTRAQLAVTVEEALAVPHVSVRDVEPVIGLSRSAVAALAKQARENGAP